MARSFDATSASYGTGGDFHERFAQRLVEVAGLKSGQTVLDIATGTAPAAIAAAYCVCLEGRVIGIDISIGILRHAQRRIADTDLSNVTICSGDAEQLPFPDATFDVSLCSSSAVWLPDIPAAFREWNRVLKPDGLLAFSCFAESAHTTTRLLRRHLQRFGIALPDLNAPLNIPEKCGKLVQQAGFSTPKITVEQWGSHLHNAEDIFVNAWNGNRSRFGLNLDETQFEKLQADYVADMDRTMTAEGFWNDMTVYFVRAVKSARVSVHGSVNA